MISITQSKSNSGKNTNTSQLTPFEEELAKASKKVREYKKACEANVVSILWKQPELYYTNDKLKLDHFTENCWKVYWQIGYDIIIKEKKQNIKSFMVKRWYLLQKPLKVKVQQIN